MYQSIANAVSIGVVLGSTYALLALGLGVIFGVVGIVNFAHGELLVVGALAGALLFPVLGNDIAFTAAAVAALGAVLGVALHRLAFRPLGRMGPLGPMVGSLALAVALDHAATFTIGVVNQGQPLSIGAGQTMRAFGFALPARLDVLGVSLSPTRVAALVGSVVIVASVGILLTRSMFGRGLKAVAWDPDAAANLGIDARRMADLGLTLSVSITMVSGVVAGALISVTPGMGLQQGLKSFVVVLCAGFGNVKALLVVGLLLGLAEGFLVEFVGTRSQYPWVFAGVIALLMVRPQGLVKERRPEER